MNASFTSEVNRVKFPDIERQLQTSSTSQNQDCVQGTSYPEVVLPPGDPVNTYGQIATQGFAFSDDFCLGLSCLAILWVFTFIGLLASRFPMAGQVIWWSVFGAACIVLAWRIVKWWRTRRRNQGYVSM